MCRPKIFKLIGFACMSLILFACGGSKDDDSSVFDSYDDSNSVFDGYDDSSSLLDELISDIEGNGNGNGNTGTYLDCSALDPQKVYLIGVVSPNDPTTNVIVDLDDPTNYCLGLTGDEGNRIVISESGQAIVVIDDDSGEWFATKIVQESYDSIPDGIGGYLWGWPQTDRTTNDLPVAELFTQTNILFLRQDGSMADEIYYPLTYTSNTDSTGPTYSTETGDTPYFDNPNGYELMGTMGDGSLLMSLGSALYLITPDFTEIALDIPDDAEYSFERTSRVFTNSAGNAAVWVLAQDTNFTNDRRLSIDLVTHEVTDDGLFAAVPDYVDPRTQENPEDSPIIGSRKKLDGQGNLVQIAFFLETPPGSNADVSDKYFQYLVIKRPVASSNQESEILVSDADYDGDFTWQLESWPTAHVYGGVLATGQ